MSTILIIVLLILIFGGGGGYYAHGRYGTAGLGGVLGVVLIVLSRRSRNQKGVRRLSNNHPRLSRAILDDPPIRIRPNCSRQRGCKGKNPLGSSHYGRTIVPKNISLPQRQFAQKMSRVSP